MRLERRSLLLANHTIASPCSCSLLDRGHAVGIAVTFLAKHSGQIVDIGVSMADEERQWLAILVLRDLWALYVVEYLGGVVCEVNDRAECRDGGCGPREPVSRPCVPSTRDLALAVRVALGVVGRVV
jgi:hypothetical protein